MRVQIDFTDHHYFFDLPIAVIQTSCMAEVKACLADAEHYTKQGYYAAGYIAYEAAPAFCPFAVVPPPKTHLPLLWFGIFNKPKNFPAVPMWVGATEKIAWQANIDEEGYRNVISRIKQQIGQGNTYQTNYTLRLRALFFAEPYLFYQRLKQAQSASYCAYIETDEHCVLSASPELFFHYKAGEITTKPMKGTAPRGRTTAEDRRYRNELFNEKNRAENMMIVDLLRNDLNQIAKTGTVRVEALFQAEKYPTVWQLTSGIHAQLPGEKTITDIFTALFPCGSITGAPKLKTMQLIAELEPEARGVYCGAIGVITPREAIFNVGIRTILLDKQNNEAVYGIGGGITWDSTAEGEYLEAIDKARILSESPVPEALVETILLEEGDYFLLEQHLSRLQDSAKYFQFCYHETEIRDKLQRIAISYAIQQYKVRLLLKRDGEICTEIYPFSPERKSIHATFSSILVDSANRFLYHKTTERNVFPLLKKGYEYLLRNERGEVTEFVQGNVAVCLEGIWYTPPLSCGLLAGTYRAKLLAEGKLQEKTLYAQDINNATEIALINSVRRWQRVHWHPNPY